MFRRKESPVKKKFTQKPSPRRVDPRTLIVIKQIVVGVVCLSLLGGLVALIWYGSRLPSMTIDAVVVSSETTIDHAEVARVVDTVLSGTYNGVIPRRFAWFYPHDEIITALTLVPRLKDPVIVRDGTTLRVSFIEYIPAALWCENRQSTACVYIDDTGYAYTTAPALSGSAFLRLYTLGTTTATGTRLMPEGDLNTLRTLAEAITTEYQLPIAAIETDVVRDAYFTISGGGELRLSLRQAAEETLINLATIVSSQEFADLRPGSFQYIDLRFGNKVFVNESFPETATTSTSTTSVLPDVEIPGAAVDVVENTDSNTLDTATTGPESAE